jgi:Xaa-Pro dipeptidase
MSENDLVDNLGGVVVIKISSELEEKEKKIRGLLKKEGLDAVALFNLSNFFWITGGADCHVISATDKGSAAVVITKDEKHAVTSNIEADRISTEELRGKGYQMVSFNWHEKNLAQAVQELTGGMSVGSDVAMPGMKLVEDELCNLRLTLTPDEVARLRKLASEASECMEITCSEIKQGDTEHFIASKLSSELLQRGITPSAVLVGTDERIFKYRHPIPTHKRLEKYAMVVVVAQRWGLHAALTRCVYLSPLPQEIQRKHEAVTKVDATFILNTKPGLEACQVLKKGIQAYAEVGFPDEWGLHHQGGVIGYQPREYTTTLDTHQIIEVNQAVAWNPSIMGTKSEDTILVTRDKPEILTDGIDWPMMTVTIDGQKIFRPNILVRI